MLSLTIEPVPGPEVKRDILTSSEEQEWREGDKRGEEGCRCRMGMTVEEVLYVAGIVL